MIRSLTLPIPDSNVSQTSVMAMVQDYVAVQWPVQQFTYDASTLEIGDDGPLRPGVVRPHPGHRARRLRWLTVSQVLSCLLSRLRCARARAFSLGVFLFLTEVPPFTRRAGSPDPEFLVSFAGSGVLHQLRPPRLRGRPWRPVRIPLHIPTPQCYGVGRPSGSSGTSRLGGNGAGGIQTPTSAGSCSETQTVAGTTWKALSRKRCDSG